MSEPGLEGHSPTFETAASHTQVSYSLQEAPGASQGKAGAVLPKGRQQKRGTEPVLKRIASYFDLQGGVMTGPTKTYSRDEAGTGLRRYSVFLSLPSSSKVRGGSFQSPAAGSR